MAVFIKNIHTQNIIFRGRDTAPGAYFQIPEIERPVWASDQNIFNYISLDQARIARSDDGTTDIMDHVAQWNYLGNLIPPTVEIVGKPSVALDKGTEEFDTLISHDWTDSSTWPSPADSVWMFEASSSSKQIRMVKSEVQFSHDVLLGSKLPEPGEFYFDVWVYNPLFDVNSAPTADDPAYIPGVSSGNPLRFLYKRTVFASIKDVFNYGNDHYTMIPAVDGINSGITTVKFNYDQAIVLRGDQGAQVRFSTKDHSPMGGDYCTVSVVIREEDIPT